FKDAIISFSKCIELNSNSNSNDAEVYLQRGTAYKHLKMLNHALTDLTKATNLTPDDGIAWLELASCQRQLHQLGEAHQSFQRAESMIDPYDTNLLLEKGALKIACGEYSQALSDCVYILEHEEDPLLRKLARIQKAKAHRLLNDIESAHKEIHIIDTKVDKMAWDVYLERGNILIAKNAIGNAITEFNKGLSIVEDPEALCARGHAYLATQRKKRKGLKDFKRALELLPGYPPALEGRKLAESVLKSLKDQ